jgi:Mn2+/Fe2+ NRAMP family transporter
MTTKEVSRPKRLASASQFVSVWGPGLLVMLADTDAGNVVTAAQSGAQWGYRLLPLWLLLAPALYIVQQLAVRLGIFTGRGFVELIRERIGLPWAWLAVVTLAIATVSSLLTELTAVAGIAEMYGLSRVVALLAASGLLLLFAMGGKYRRIERAAIIVGLFELAFFAVAWAAPPDPGTVLRQLSQVPMRNSAFLYITAAVIGAAFNPWMIIYQQASVVEKRLSTRDYKYACWDTAFGAVLTQALSAAVLIGAATTLGAVAIPGGLQSIGEVSIALQAAIGASVGRLVFSIGVLGAAMVAAIVASLALAWSVREVTGLCRSSGGKTHRMSALKAVYAFVLIGSAALVLSVHDLVGLNIAAQVVNVFLLPVVFALLFILSCLALPEALRLRGWYRVVVGCVFCIICTVSWIGALSQMW